MAVEFVLLIADYTRSLLFIANKGTSCNCRSLLHAGYGKAKDLFWDTKRCSSRMFPKNIYILFLMFK